MEPFRVLTETSPHPATAVMCAPVPGQPQSRPFLEHPLFPLWQELEAKVQSMKSEPPEDDDAALIQLVNQHTHNRVVREMMWQDRRQTWRFCEDCMVDFAIQHGIASRISLLSAAHRLHTCHQQLWDRALDKARNQLQAASQEVEQNYDRKRKYTEELTSAKVMRANARRLPMGALSILKNWFREHIITPEGPYPDNDEKEQLMLETGLDLEQIDNWFTNARRRDKYYLQHKRAQAQQQGGGSGNDDTKQG